MSSFSMREVMRKCGTKNLSGGTHSHISRLVREYEISTKHFVGQAHGLGGRSFTKKPSSDFLVYHENGTRQRSAVLTRALLEIGRVYKCFKCGIREWQGSRIVLEIEHKDADFQNDVADNLEFICPNCHSQTETFCRGPKLKGINERKSAKLAKKIIGRTKNHPSVDGYWRTRDKPNLRKVERPSPLELQSLIQSMPMTRIGEKFGVSDNAVRKWIVRYGMQLPKVWGRSKMAKRSV